MHNYMDSNHFWFKSRHSCQTLFNAIGTPALYNPDTYLFIQGETTEYLYYLIEGQVKIVVFWEDGAEKTLIIHNGGSILGEVSAFNQLPQFTTAIVTEPSTLIKVKTYDLIDYLSNKPDLMLSFFQEMGTKIHLLTLQLSTMTFLTVEKRICYTLLMLTQDSGSDTTEGLKISVRITDQELANLIGTSRVTVSKVLSSLKKHNLVTKIKNHIYILDIDGLRNFVFSKTGLTWNV